MLSREDRLATLERMGLPDSARFSHATIIKIAAEADADVVVYGRFQSDGKTATLEARLLHLSPPSLSPPLTETSSMQDLLRAHARLTWQIMCAIDPKQCPQQGASRDESSFSDPPASLRLDALENFVRGLTGSQDEERLRLLREAARLEPAWDRPAFELGQIYFKRRDCDSALVWYSRVPPNRPDGPVASFSTGVCHLARNDAGRADAAFSGLLERTHKSGEKDSLPELPEMHNNLGVARLRLGKWSEAGTEFDRASTLDPEEADYWVNNAIAKIIGKQAAAAVAPLERARKIDPDDKGAKALLIATLESLGRNPEAAAIRAEATDSADKDAAAEPPGRQWAGAAGARVQNFGSRAAAPWGRSSRRSAGGREGTSQDRQRGSASMRDTGNRRTVMISAASYAWMLAVVTFAVALTGAFTLRAQGQGDYFPAPAARRECSNCALAKKSSR